MGMQREADKSPCSYEKQLRKTVSFHYILSIFLIPKPAHISLSSPAPFVYLESACNEHLEKKLHCACFLHWPCIFWLCVYKASTPTSALGSCCYIDHGVTDEHTAKGMKHKVGRGEQRILPILPFHGPGERQTPTTA